MPSSPPAAGSSPPLFRSNSLRRRLLLSYALVIGLAALLASAASLLVVARRAGQEARLALESQAATLGNVVESLAASPPSGPDTLLQALFADVSLRRSGQPILVLDGAGRPLISLHPPPPGGRPNLGPLRGLPLRAVRRPLDPDASFVLLQPGSDGTPPAREFLSTDRRRLLYSTLALPETLRPAFVALLPPGLQEMPAHLALVRQRLDLRGALRGLLPSVLLVGALVMLPASLLAWGLARSISRPVAVLTAATGRMAAGDYSVRVALEDQGEGELAQLGQSFNHMAGRVQEADARQRDFVANVSHDLRTPLTALRGFARALLDGTAKSPEQQKRALEAIDAASERMARLTETLLTLARLERGVAATALQPRSLPLAPFLEACAAAASGAEQTAGATVRVDCPPGLRASLDEDWMARALANLLENALRFSPQGGRVVLGAEALTPAADHGLRLWVEDEGPGLSPTDLDRAFDRFYRGDPARRAGGSGLGLAIAKEIVEAHGGRIAIANRPAGGARVEILLPDVPQGTRPAPPATAPERGGEEG